MKKKESRAKKKYNNKNAIAFLKTVDPLLGSIIKKPLPEIKEKKSVYDALLSSIISQQISLAAARSIENKFLTLFNNTFPSVTELLHTENETLQSVGLSKQKIDYLKNVATYFETNNLTEHDFKTRSDEDTITLLTQIKGVGRWTAEMILIFSLEREDVFSVQDLGLIRPIEKLYNLRKTKTLQKRILAISKKWSPHRTLASRYLWAYKDNKFL